jgi:hypothetical protein
MAFPQISSTWDPSFQRLSTFGAEFSPSGWWYETVDLEKLLFSHEIHTGGYSGSDWPDVSSSGFPRWPTALLLLLVNSSLKENY